tara:strand:- start:515 stop:1075 length:561 start_codon:yes stop_codon:yes gene_type:complete
MLEITDKAREMLHKFSEQSDNDLVALKVEIVGRGPKGFQYDLQLISKEDAMEDDIESEIGDLVVFVGARSAPYLEGTILDYKETLMGGGFSFENPNPLWIDDVSKAVAEVISNQVNPLVASHGGHVDLVGVDGGNAMISFGGGCQGCGMVDVTLKEGIEVMITEEVPEITAVIDMTDHEAGTNPFY